MRLVLYLGKLSADLNLGQYFRNPPRITPGPAGADVDVYLDSGMLRLHLGGTEYLDWREWPDDIASAPREDRAGRRKVNMHGRIVDMPRKMWCYGRPYPFSGQMVPQEPVTPPEIATIMEATSELFRLAEPVNMCLTNDYGSGREAISEHSDDEALAPGGRISEVVCWVDGPASRDLVIREVGTRLVVMKISIPRSIYSMTGPEFQSRFTHQVPELYPALYKKMVAFASERDDFPAGTIDRSRWLVDNSEWVLGRLEGKDVTRYNEWRAWRVSHTLRRFR